MAECGIRRAPAIRWVYDKVFRGSCGRNRCGTKCIVEVRLEYVGDVLEEDQAEDDVFVLGRVHVVAQGVDGGPELRLEAEVGSGLVGLGSRSCRQSSFCVLRSGSRDWARILQAADPVPMIGKEYRPEGRAVQGGEMRDRLSPRTRTSSNTTRSGVGDEVPRSIRLEPGARRQYFPAAVLLLRGVRELSNSSHRGSGAV